MNISIFKMYYENTRIEMNTGRIIILHHNHFTLKLKGYKIAVENKSFNVMNGLFLQFSYIACTKVKRIIMVQ